MKIFIQQKLYGSEREIKKTKKLNYRPREDERLSWPCWLTYSGRFTRINGYLSAAACISGADQ